MQAGACMRALALLRMQGMHAQSARKLPCVLQARTCAHSTCIHARTHTHIHDTHACLCTHTCTYTCVNM